MQIDRHPPQHATTFSGEESLELDAGDVLKIEKILGTGPETILNEAVPTGKRWILRIDVVGDEVDA